LAVLARTATVEELPMKARLVRIVCRLVGASGLGLVAMTALAQVRPPTTEELGKDPGAIRQQREEQKARELREQQGRQQQQQDEQWNQTVQQQRRQDADAA
jgi:hypothetical protein